ncbi:MAG: hypothetical protein KDB22_22080, partial [Planctomycetales bacterium]|nr:hypothetical protein [Planctomycetales bacterium]
QGKTPTGDYSGNGTELLFVQAKEQLRLLGDARRSAIVRAVRSDDPGKSTATAYVQEAVIDTRTQEVQVIKFAPQGAKWESGTQAPSDQPRPGQTVPSQSSSNAASQPRSAVDNFLRPSRP